jgi:hypothetical protein
LKGKLLLLLIIAIIAPATAYLLLPSSGPTVSITKLDNLSLQTGQSIIVNVTVSDVSDLISCRINLAFDPSVLKVTTGDPHGWRDELTGISYGIYEGPFFKSFTNSTIFLINDLNNQAGNITAIFDAITVGGISASGSGVVATINFTCVHPTTNTAIRITGPSQGHSTLQTTTAFQIPHQDIDGLVTAGGSPGIWTELWFQATVSVVIVEIIVLALGIFVTIRWWRSRAEAESQERAAVEDLFKEAASNYFLSNFQKFN